MTAICPGGGSSSPRPEYGSALAMGASAIAALLNNIPTMWAVPLAGYLGLLTYDLVDFCSVDPPPVPNITAGDVAALLTVLDPIGHTQALVKFQQLIGAYLWYSVCKCDAGATPPAPVPLPAPPGMPTINPPGLAPPQPIAWCDYTRFHASPFETGGTGQWVYLAVHPDVTSAVLDLNNNQLGGGPHSAMNRRVEWADHNHLNVLRTDTYTLAAGAGARFTVPVPQGSREVWVHIENVTAGTTDQVDDRIEFYCGPLNGPTSPTPQPCPADPVSLGLLHQILELVTLIQRQKVPFAYIPGPRHVGLTGAGQVSLTSPIGVSVQVTNMPAYIGLIGGTPAEFFDLGFVTLGNADGWARSVRLDHNPLLIQPIDATWSTLGYSLEPNVVVDVQELKREA